MTNSMTELSNATFLDYDSYGTNFSGTMTGSAVSGAIDINVALIVQRQNDPSALLSGGWASRQAALSDQNAIRQFYGANPVSYASAASFVTSSLGLGLLSGGYVTGPEARTIWVHLDNAAEFDTLFGTPLMRGKPVSGVVTDNSGFIQDSTYYWSGNLSLPDQLVSLGVTELVFAGSSFNAVVASGGVLSGVVLSSGAQSPGNSAESPNRYPSDIAQDAYNFPISGAFLDPTSPSALPTGTIGLIEPGEGVAVSGSSPTSNGKTFADYLDDYRSGVFGGPVPGVTAIGVASGGQFIGSSGDGERALDASIATAIAPQSPLVLYAGAGPNADGFTAMESALWDDVNNPQVISDSWGTPIQGAPGSPFKSATDDQFVDAALHNIVTLIANGDGGSSYEIPNGITNVGNSTASLYSILVGGTSLSDQLAAQRDHTLAPYLSGAHSVPSPAQLWQLIAGGLTTLPGTSTSATVVETVWNQYTVSAVAHQSNTYVISSYLQNDAGTGGPDPSQPIPSYQYDFGLDAMTSGFRGTPDVAANAGGNTFYKTLNATLTGLDGEGGTSAATPLWAALVTQFNAIFADLGLPSLGYMTDLLYIADVIDPAAFNDITIGNNSSTLLLGSATSGPRYVTSDGNGNALDVTPTGIGFSATSGYDLTTGLGTPNGLLLARSLTHIAESEIYYSGTPDVVVSGATSGTWKSGVTQSLLFQATGSSGTTVSVSAGGVDAGFDTAASAPFAWTARMAQQSLQSDFSSGLVTMFDGESQGTLMQATVSSGATIDISVGSAATSAPQARLSQPFGFADFVASGGTVRVAQSVAVAETVSGSTADGQTAVARIRHNGVGNDVLTFYAVADYEGTLYISGGGTVKPGDDGYIEAAEASAYTLSENGTTIGNSIAGGAYGALTTVELENVKAGQLVAMLLQNASQTFFAFAPGNEMVRGQNVAHLWNYGANTWGWEDAWGGGDRDYNDVVVQLDFTATAGQGILNHG